MYDHTETDCEEPDWLGIWIHLLVTQPEASIIDGKSQCCIYKGRHSNEDQTDEEVIEDGRHGDEQHMGSVATNEEFSEFAIPSPHLDSCRGL